MIRKVVSSARRPKAAVFRGKNEQKAQKIYFDRALRTPHVEVVCGHFAKVIFSIFSDILVLVPFPDFEHLQFVHKFELSALEGRQNLSKSARSSSRARNSIVRRGEQEAPHQISEDENR